MANVLFTNVRILDGSGEMPYSGEVLVQGNRIHRIGRGSRSLALGGMTVIDGAGATLMPGMTEAHTHFSWNDQPSLSAIQMMPPEEHILWCVRVAKRYLDAGWTSCVGAATAKPRLDVVLRNAISAGEFPGPRYLAASRRSPHQAAWAMKRSRICLIRTQLRCRGERTGRDAPDRPHVHQVRRRYAEDQSLR